MDVPSIVSDQWDGRVRKLFEKTCSLCPKTYYVPEHVFHRSKFCSLECTFESRRKRISSVCPHCLKDFKARARRLQVSKSGVIFWNRKCKDEAQSIGGVFQQKHANTGAASYRQRAFKLFGKICCQCKYDHDKRMLDVDHIDGHRENGKSDNLQVLCVWCHALKTRILPDPSRVDGN